MTFLCYIQDLPEECHLLISPDLLPTAPKVSNQLDNIGVYPLITLHDDQNNRVIRLVHHHNISAYYRNHDHVVYTSTSTDLYRTDIHTPRDKAFYHTIAQDTSGRPPCQMYMLHLVSKSRRHYGIRFSFVGTARFGRFRMHLNHNFQRLGSLLQPNWNKG